MKPTRTRAFLDQPGFFEQIGELRLLSEMVALVPSLPFLMHAPRGDGHGVLVLPGLYADDGPTIVIRRYLEMLGYGAHPWLQGFNLGPDRVLYARMSERLDKLANRYGEKISLVGWSMGGIYARELAKQHPTLVRQVITLGSPFRAGYTAGGRMDPALAERLRLPPPVPTTAIYSRSDGVVPWTACREEDSPLTDNIEVPSSHMGLCVNPTVLWAVANRLAVAEGTWAPFDKSGYRAIFYSGK
ncbi:MAG: alpha/beta hydrolase [Parvibaculaceae bacterium]|nr:alpha/beta hydrolase [Parvibaculaceae bacterium]